MLSRRALFALLSIALPVASAEAATPRRSRTGRAAKQTATPRNRRRKTADATPPIRQA